MEILQIRVTAFVPTTRQRRQRTFGQNKPTIPFQARLKSIRQINAAGPSRIKTRLRLCKATHFVFAFRGQLVQKASAGRRDPVLRHPSRGAASNPVFQRHGLGHITLDDLFPEIVGRIRTLHHHCFLHFSGNCQHSIGLGKHLKDAIRIFHQTLFANRVCRAFQRVDHIGFILGLIYALFKISAFPKTTQRRIHQRIVPTLFQLAYLPQNCRRMTVLTSRHSPKTFAVLGMRDIIFGCVRHPIRQATFRFDNHFDSHVDPRLNSIHKITHKLLCNLCAILLRKN